MDNIYGNQCGSDNAFTQKARLLQSMYRVEIGEKEGVGPTRTSKRKKSAEARSRRSAAQNVSMF